MTEVRIRCCNELILPLYHHTLRSIIWFLHLLNIEVTVEREGLSVTYPCKPLVIATYNPEEGELREHLRDRFAISLSTDARLLSTKERVAGVDNVLGFSGGLQHQSSDEAEKRLNQAEIDEQNKTHLPWSSWCAACVGGGAVAHPHFPGPDEPESTRLPHCLIDYFLRAKKKIKSCRWSAWRKDKARWSSPIK